MGFLDDALNQAKDLAKEHPDVVKNVTDQVEQVVDEKTGGQFTEHIQSAGDAVEGFLGQ